MRYSYKDIIDMFLVILFTVLTVVGIVQAIHMDYLKGTFFLCLAIIVFLVGEYISEPEISIVCDDDDKNNEDNNDK